MRRGPRLASFALEADDLAVDEQIARGGAEHLEGLDIGGLARFEIEDVDGVARDVNGEDLPVLATLRYDASNASAVSIGLKLAVSGRCW